MPRSITPLYGWMNSERAEQGKTRSAREELRATLQTKTGALHVTLSANGNFDVYLHDSTLRETPLGSHGILLASGNVNDGSRYVQSYRYHEVPSSVSK